MTNTSLDIGVALKVSTVKDACSVILVAHVILHDCKEIVHQEHQWPRGGEIAGQWIEGKVSYALKLAEDHVTVD